MIALAVLLSTALVVLLGCLARSFRSDLTPAEKEVKRVAKVMAITAKAEAERAARAQKWEAAQVQKQQAREARVRANQSEAYARALAQVKLDPAAYYAFLALAPEHQAECLTAIAQRQASNRTMTKWAIAGAVLGYAAARHANRPPNSGLFDTPKVF
jgi:hypothetical protein